MGWVLQSRTRIERVVSGTGTPGTRAAPTQAGSNDAKIGLRLDYGEKFRKDGKTYMRVNLQVNKGAENPTLKALANKNSHEVWSYADILVESEQVDANATNVAGSSGQKVAIDSGPSGENTFAQARLMQPKSSVQGEPVEEKAVKMFEDLKANMKG